MNSTFSTKGTIFTLKFPDGKTGEYNKNVGRNLLVGKNSMGKDNLDVYYFSNETLTSIDLEVPTSDLNEGGYIKVYLKDSDEKEEILHRMIAYSWIPEFKPGINDIDHIDGNKLNNTVTNLKAVPPLYNAYKEFKNGNMNARTYLSNAVKDTRKIANTKDFLDAVIFILREEGYIVVNEVSTNLSEHEVNALIYLLKKHKKI
jgi:hypothetical protein